MKELRLLLVDDMENKIKWLVNILEKQEGIFYNQCTCLNDACTAVNTIKYDGIVLDMKFPIEKYGDEENRAGEIFLDKLGDLNIEIPVLGNSNIPFDTKYKLFYGQIRGFINRDKVLNKFLEQIKRQS